MDTRYLRKATDVVGYTYDGGAYCPECVAYTDPTVTGESQTDTRVDKPHPIFGSDEDYEGWVCEVCRTEIG